MSVRAFSTARAPLDADEEMRARVVPESPCGIVITTLAEGRILDCNEGFLALSGYTRAEVLDRSAVELGMWVDTRDRDGLIAALQAHHRVKDFTARIRTKTGEGKKVVVDVETIDLDGLACVLAHVSEMTAQRNAEAAKAAVEAQYRTLIEQIPAITYTQNLNEAPTYTYVSPQVEAILGFAATEMADHPDFLTERLHEDDRAAVIAEDARARESGGSFRLEYRVRARDGRWVWLRDEAILVRDVSGRPLYWQGVLLDVTDQRQAEVALQLVERRYRSLVQNSYDVITVLNPDGSRQYVSPSLAQILGYDPNELLQDNVFNLVHPDDAPRLRDEIERCLHGAKATAALNLRFRHRNGDWRKFEAIGTNLLQEPSVGGIVFNSRDITAREAAESSLRESEERFRSAFDHAPIGLAVISTTRIGQVNRSLCDLLGYSEAELLGKSLEDITHPDDLADYRDAAQRFWSGEISTYHLETRLLRKEGHPIWVQLTASAVQDGGPRYGIIQVQDVTDRRHLDMERAVMLATEREYTRQLQDLAAMRTDLSAMVAHELRSPIAALRVMTSMLGTNELSPREETETIVAIHAQLDQLDRLVTDVAGAAAAERDDFSVQLQPVSLAMLLGGVAIFARTALDNHPFAMTDAPDVRVWCDPERISQVLRNLLDNAAKHTPAGTPVALRASAAGGWVQIDVADGGPGIAADDLGLIFEKFARGRTTVAGQTPGAGLGLYLSRQIVQAHGGELTVVSTPREGSVFRFALKVAA